MLYMGESIPLSSCGSHPTSWSMRLDHLILAYLPTVTIPCQTIIEKYPTVAADSVVAHALPSLEEQLLVLGQLRTFQGERTHSKRVKIVRDFLHDDIRNVHEKGKWII